MPGWPVEQPLRRLQEEDGTEESAHMNWRIPRRRTRLTTSGIECICPLQPEPVHQITSRELQERVGPEERGKQCAHARGGNAEVSHEGNSRYAQIASVDVIRQHRKEQQADHQPSAAVHLLEL